MFQTAWKMSKYGVISGPYFPSARKYGQEITLYLDIFRAVPVKKTILVNDSDIKVIANKFKWKYLRQEEVNLLVYGPEQPLFEQKQKNNIAKFWLTGFF